jgi:TetR/AcrR family transcriptional repressor of nem operon
MPEAGATKRSGARTRAGALDVAEALAQVRGFNAFSYGDIAERLGVTTASLHYHFPAKADLGVALIDRYSAAFAEALAEIEADESGATSRLAAYVGVYDRVLRNGRMCLCGMLATEFHTLPEAMRGAILGFFELNETWLERVLEQGRERGEIDFSGSARETGRSLVAGLEGAMLMARANGGPGAFEETADRLLAGLTAAGAAGR